MTTEIQEKIEQLNQLEHHLGAYGHALSLFYVDGTTIAPAASAAKRGDTISVLAAERQKLFTAESTGELLHFLSDHAAELDRATARRVEILSKKWNKEHQIPLDEFVAYQKLKNEAGAVWVKAKNENDYASFAPYLDRLVEASINMTRYDDPTGDPYEILLNNCEEGFTSDVLDVFFGKVKEHLVPLIHRIQTCDTKINDDFLFRYYPKHKQEAFSQYLMDVLQIDKTRCTLTETEHPYTSGMNHTDVRITTHYYENAVARSMFSVIHEGGHALYVLGNDPANSGTCLLGGASCGIHEAQSRFYENLIGRSEAFIELIFPKMQEFFPEQLADVTAHDFYLAVNKVFPDTIRMKADELTYSLHILIRYEIEKKLFHKEITSKEVPELWRQLYKDYLGVDVPDDTTGALQDSHWSGTLFGYFPSYSLGSAYGAQVIRSMEKDIDVYGAVRSGDLTPINEWLRDKIFRYGLILKPAEVIENCCGTTFDADYYIDYLVTKFTKIYNL